MARDLDHKAKLPTWEPNAPAASLEAFAKALVFEPLEVAIAWYFAAKNHKKLAGRALRVLTWATAGVAVIIPVAIETYRRNDGGLNAMGLRAGHASLALLLAAGLLWLDRFYGFTSGWLRYMEVCQRLLELRDRFTIEWAMVHVGWPEGAPKPEHVREAMDRVLAMNAQVHAVVRDETKAWVAEFRDALRQLEEQVQRRHEAQQQQGQGGLEVEAELPEGARLPEGWSLSVSGQGAATAVAGPRASLALPTGVYQVRGEARLVLADGSTRRAFDEKAAAVETGRVVVVKLRFD